MDNYLSNAEIDRQGRVSDDARCLLKMLSIVHLLRMSGQDVYETMPADSPVSPILIEFLNGLEATETDAHAALDRVEHGRYANANPGVAAMADLGRMLMGEKR